jgi:hypothetical protein
MDQGKILAKKRLYRKRFLEEVVVTLENETGKSDDKRATYVTMFEKLHPKINNFQLCSTLKSSTEPTIRKWFGTIFK